MGTNNWAFSIWFKFDSTGTYALFDIGTSGGAVAVAMMSDTNMRLTAYSPAQNVDFDATVPQMAANTWHHFLAQKYGNTGGSQAKTYLNGVLIKDGIFSTTTDFGTNTNTSVVGKLKNYFSGYNLPGNVDEFAYFSNSLSDGGVSVGETAGGDVAEIYNNGTPGDLSNYSPVGWWRMGDNNSGAGSIITDKGSGGSDATINGATFSPDTPFSTHCIHFDKTNDYLDLGDLSPLVGAKETLSYSLWVKVHDTSNVQGILGNTTGGANSLFGEVYYYNDILAVNHFSKNHPVNIGMPINQDEWYHLVVTFNRGETYYYLNGTERAYFPYSYILTTKTLSTLYSTLKLGRCDRFNQEGNVSLDEFALFEQELSPSDVTEIYNSGYPKPLHKYYPIGWWRMGDTEGGTGTTIADLGSGGNDGTLVNSPSFSNQTPSNT